MSMQRFYSLVNNIQDDRIKDALYAWAAKNIFEVSIEHAEAEKTPSEYARHNAERSMMELGKVLFEEHAKVAEITHWTSPDRTKITRRTIRLLRDSE